MDSSVQFNIENCSGSESSSSASTDAGSSYSPVAKYYKKTQTSKVNSSSLFSIISDDSETSSKSFAATKKDENRIESDSSECSINQNSINNKSLHIIEDDSNNSSENGDIVKSNSSKFEANATFIEDACSSDDDDDQDALNLLHDLECGHTWLDVETQSTSTPTAKAANRVIKKTRRFRKLIDGSLSDILSKTITQFNSESGYWNLQRGRGDGVPGVEVKIEHIDRCYGRIVVHFVHDDKKSAIILDPTDGIVNYLKEGGLIEVCLVLDRRLEVSGTTFYFGTNKVRVISQ